MHGISAASQSLALSLSQVNNNTLIIAGLVLIILGLICVLFGIVGGAKLMFRRQNEPGAQSSFPTELLKVVRKLIGAPVYQVFFFGGIVLILLGLFMDGGAVFTS